MVEGSLGWARKSHRPGSPRGLSFAEGARVHRDMSDAYPNGNQSLYAESKSSAQAIKIVMDQGKRVEWV